jgi:hypothetical protein
MRNTLGTLSQLIVLPQGLLAALERRFAATTLSATPCFLIARPP